MATSASALRYRLHPTTLLLSVALYAMVWWILAGDYPRSWLWGIPACVAAALLNPIPAPHRVLARTGALLRFIPVFVAFSITSAVDVSWRALHPRCPLQPVLVDYPWRLPPGPARIFLASLVNLMPGTLGLRIGREALTLHILRRPRATLDGVRRFEAHAAALFGVALDG